MPNDRQTRDFIKREVQGRGETITGTVITRPALKFFGVGVSEQYVVDVTIGDNREIKNVPIKPIGGNYSYSELGQTVKLQRNLDQKFQIIGPGDREIGITVIKTSNPGGPVLSTSNQGQTFVRRPYEFYKGGLPGIPGSGLYGIQVGYPLIQKLDGDGNVIP